MIVMNRVLDAPPALRRFLDARSTGASRDELQKLSDEAMAEQARLKAARSREPVLRLVADRDRDLVTE